MPTLDFFCGNLEALDQGFTESQKQTFFLVGIKDEEFENIKDSCDNKSFHETVLELKKILSRWEIMVYLQSYLGYKITTPPFILVPMIETRIPRNL